jgi:hypothetical protein
VAEPKADSFTAFLKAKARLQSSSVPAPPARPAAAHAADVKPPPSPLSLLFKLAETRELPLGELQAASGMAFSEFAQALKNLEDLGYLTVSGSPGHEVARLTKPGEDVARLAHPAS